MLNATSKKVCYVASRKVFQKNLQAQQKACKYYESCEKAFKLFRKVCKLFKTLTSLSERPASVKVSGKGCKLNKTLSNFLKESARLAKDLQVHQESLK